MPLTVTAEDCEHPIALCTWNVQDRAQLVRAIALLAATRAAHVEKIIHKRRTTEPKFDDATIDRAIRKLGGNLVPDSPLIAERDGWLFQFVSWLALQVGSPALLVRAPHVRKSDKGLDGFAIQLDGSRVVWVMVSEDKATEHPRKTVLEVWSEFANFEAGLRDDEITSDAEALLSTRGISPDEVTGDPKWIRERRYRASVATSHGNLPKEVHTFQGYDDHVVGGDSDRRGANLFLHNDMRRFLHELALDAATELDAMRPTLCSIP